MGRTGLLLATMAAAVLPTGVRAHADHAGDALVRGDTVSSAYIIVLEGDGFERPNERTVKIGVG